MKPEQPKKYTKDEIAEMEKMRKRVSDLDKNSTMYLKDYSENADTNEKLLYREAVHELAKSEDEFRSDPSPDKYSTSVMKEMEAQKGEAEAIEKSLADALTGLGNVERFNLIVGATLKRFDPEKERREHSLIRIDLDNFKRINDDYKDHSIGDQVLIGVANTILNTLRTEERGSAYRKGGDEFVIFLPHTNLKEAANVAERIRENIEKLTIKDSNGKEIKITASIGCSSTKQISSGTAKEKNIEELDKNADVAAYYSKEVGRNRVTIFDSSVVKER